MASGDKNYFDFETCSIMRCRSSLKFQAFNEREVSALIMHNILDRLAAEGSK
jgi:hypothetical protein